MKLHKILRAKDLCTLGSIGEESEEFQCYIVVLYERHVLDLVFRTMYACIGGSSSEQVSSHVLRPFLWGVFRTSLGNMFSISPSSSDYSHLFICLNISAERRYE